MPPVRPMFPRSTLRPAITVSVALSNGPPAGSYPDMTTEGLEARAWAVSEITDEGMPQTAATSSGSNLDTSVLYV